MHQIEREILRQLSIHNSKAVPILLANDRTDPDGDSSNATPPTLTMPNASRHDVASAPPPHYVCSVSGHAEHLQQTAQSWLRTQVRLLVTEQKVIYMSWSALLAELDADPAWQGYAETDQVVALNTDRALLLRAHRPDPHYSRHNDDATQQAISLTVTGRLADARDWLAALAQRHPTRQPIIHWLHNKDADEVRLPVREDMRPHPAMFPFLPMPLNALYDAFAASEAPVLLLIGPPGTGKTSFIRGYLQHTHTNAMVSYDPAVLTSDDLFARFMSQDTPVFALEDADQHLQARTQSDTPSLMHRFLSISDGLVSARGKKLIFSTNLPTTQDVDAALLRPGRCYAVLPFRALTPSEGAALLNALGRTDPPPQQDRTLAELLQTQPTGAQLPQRSLGFL